MYYLNEHANNENVLLKDYLQTIITHTITGGLKMITVNWSSLDGNRGKIYLK